MYNFRRKFTLCELLMVYAIKNFTYRGDFAVRRSRNQKRDGESRMEDRG
jgi:hypothetical protein